LVAILDADNEGFLRSATSLIQTAGRAARHVNGAVILYADRITDSIQTMVSTTQRRREVQLAYNTQHGITPIGIQKKIFEGIEAIKKVREIVQEATGLDDESYERQNLISELEAHMEEAARNLQFEKAILIRDEIRKLRESGAGLNPTKEPNAKKSQSNPIARLKTLKAPKKR